MLSVKTSSYAVAYRQSLCSVSKATIASNYPETCMYEAHLQGVTVQRDGDKSKLKFKIEKIIRN